MSSRRAGLLAYEQAPPVGGDDASVDHAAPVLRRGVADGGEGRAAEFRRRRHPLTLHDQLAFAIGWAHHCCRVVTKDPGMGGRFPALSRVTLNRSRIAA